MFAAVLADIFIAVHLAFSVFFLLSVFLFHIPTSTHPTKPIISNAMPSTIAVPMMRFILADFVRKL